MKKKYIVEFTDVDGNVETVELVTDNIDWSIQQYCRNRAIVESEIKGSTDTPGKQMLFG